MRIAATIVGATAILASSAATAAEWRTGVRGYYNLGFEVAESFDGVGILRDGEFLIFGTLKADNGLTFRAQIEVESATQGDQIDENWGSVSGSFGEIRIGGDDTVKARMANGYYIGENFITGYYNYIPRASATAREGLAGNGLDPVGIHYFSPNISGFQFGASYIPQSGSDNAGDSNNPVFNADAPGDNTFAFAARYDGKFGDFGIGLSGGYIDGEGIGDAYHVGGNISYAGFGVAAHFEDDADGNEWTIGGRYQEGPWTVAGGFANENQPGHDNRVLAAWATYKLLPGVSLTASVENHDSAAENVVNGFAYMTIRF